MVVAQVLAVPLSVAAVAAGGILLPSDFLAVPWEPLRRQI